MAPWHDDRKAREEVGRSGEADFDQTFICMCGGKFVRNDQENPYAIDRKCEDCGRLVDVKTCEDAMAYSCITISAPAFDHYGPEAIIIARFGDEWMGQRVGRLEPDGPYPPAHEGRRSTPFYKIRRDQFYPAENYIRRNHREVT